MAKNWPFLALNRRPVLSFGYFLMGRGPGVLLGALGVFSGQNWSKLAIFEI